MKVSHYQKQNGMLPKLKHYLGMNTNSKNTSNGTMRLIALVGLAGIVLQLLLPTKLQAADERSATYLQANRFKEGAILILKDNKIYGPNGYQSGWKSQFDIHRTHNLLSLKINPAAKGYGKNSFSVKLDLKLLYKNAEDNIVQQKQGQDTSELSLKVSYNKQGHQTYKQQDVYHFTGGHYVLVKVAGVTITGSDTSGLANLVTLQSEMRIERYYPLANQKVQNLSHAYQSHDNELKVHWQDMVGAEDYELEYTFVDNYGHGGGSGKSQINYNFEKNSQRVRIDESHYRIPIVYEQGFLVYRVRPLGRGGANFDKIKNGKWSTSASGKVIAATPHVYTVKGNRVHEADKKNWLYKAAFAEDGKRSVSMTYFDGSNRNRQSLSRLSSDNFALVSETLYDYEGREAVNTLPAPAAKAKPSAAIHYFHQFNQNQQGQKYSRSDFDTMSAAGCGLNLPNPMSKSSGTSRYYSSQNNMPTPFKDRLPETEGYPFSQTRFVPTEGNMPSRQSRPGKKLQLGSGHEIKLFYSTSPMQIELDRMFGSEAGKAEHYRKVITFDENGQARVKYKNNDGKVVASGLKGAPPSNLKSLPSSQVNQSQLKGEVLQSSNERNDLSWEATHQFVVTAANTQYTFQYNLKPSKLQRDLCDGRTICYDGIYDVSIRLEDNCGNIIKDTTARVGDLSNLDGQCDNYGPLKIAMNSGPLKKGNYILSKTLSLDEQAVQAYVDSFANEHCWQTKYDSIKKEQMKDVDSASCVQGCGGVKAAKVYRDTLPNGRVIEDSLSPKEQGELQARINSFCGGGANMCQMAYEMMLNDMTPGGQYARFHDTTQIENADGDTVPKGFNPSAFPLSILDRNNDLPRRNASWKNPTRPYRDTTGQISWIRISSDIPPQHVDSIIQRPGYGGYYTKPQYLKYASDFKEYWQDSWAYSLVKYHPEYCYYQYCSQFPNSNTFDSELLQTGKYQAAQDSGFISGGTPNLLSQDPYFQQQPQLRAEMKDTMKKLIDLDTVAFSIKEIVISMHHGCSVFACVQTGNAVGGVKQCIQNNSPIFAGKDTTLQNQLWKSYRSIYLALKRSIIERERHQYAAQSCGVYNGCIGVKDALGRQRESAHLMSLFNGNIYQAYQNTQPCFVAGHYQDKTKRFPDNDDMYDYMDDIERPSSIANAQAEAENMESFVDNYMQRECDKCPQESDLESFLNSLSTEGRLTQSGIDANRAIATCDLVNSMGLPNASKGFKWKATTTKRELTGEIYYDENTYCTIKLYDTAGSPVKWEKILMFTCLEQTNNPVHYSQPQDGIFKVRAITKDKEVSWLEGKVSCMQLANCSVPNYCQTNQVADDLVKVFNRVFGYYPVMRQLLLQGGNTQAASNIPVHPGTNLMVDGVEITNTMSTALKTQHKQAGPNRKFFWRVDTVAPDTNGLVAGIYTKESCGFFMYTDSTNSLDKPFMITDVIVNHPDLETEGCEQKEFYLEARYVEMNILAPNYAVAAQPKSQVNFNFGKTFLIKVTNECYSVAECCPEKECPELTFNGQFSNGDEQFRSDLTAATSIRGSSFYGMKQNIDLDSSNLSTQYTGQQIPVQNLPNQQINLNQVNNFQNLQDFQIDSPQTQSSGQFQINTINQNITNVMQNVDIQQLNNPQLLQTMNLGAQGIPAIQTGQVQGVLLSGSPNNYLVFYPAQSQQQTIWKQEVGLTGGETYTMTCRVKLEQAANNFTQSQVNWQQLLSWKVGNTTGKWQVNSTQTQGQWAELTATYQAPSTDAYDLAIRFDGNNNYHNHIWAIDNISVQADNCKNPMCCPPIMPKMPPNTYENPCVSKQKEIAEENTRTIIDQFMEDTLRGIREAFIAKAMDVDESLTKSFQTYTYDMTLSYYDQAGNLVKTIPPKGYNPLNKNKAQQVNQNRQSSTPGNIQPNHTMATTYQYNTLDEVVERTTPDGGTTRYWYDKLGRIVASQNGEQRRISFQAGGPNNHYNYRKYDELGRVVETGELINARKMQHQIAKDKSMLQTWRQGGEKRYIKRTYYDEPLSTKTESYFGSEGQEFLRKRIATITYDKTDKDDGGNLHENYDYAIHYSYDVHGNAKTVIREVPELAAINHNLKRIDYEYDLLSGNITKIIYQKHQPDQFMHKYEYDAGNRLLSVHTSRNGLVWQQDARYYYHPHGALARVELGEESVQGIDYAYTLQGWIKGMNASTVNPNDDLGADAVAGRHEHIAADAVGYGREYFQNDYQPAGSGAGNPFTAANTTGNTGKDLFNGNVNHTISAKRGHANTLAMAYQYDQLGRLVQMQAFEAMGGGFQQTHDYQSTFAYDANGNMTSIKRNGTAASGQQKMDDLTYNYQSGTNRIDYIQDQAGSGGYPTDLDNQTAGNYSYDDAGRMTADKESGIDNVVWNARNKIESVTKGNKTIDYAYGPQDQRVKKQQPDGSTTYYFRGPNGSVLAKYYKVKDTFEVAQFNIYGQSRLGTYTPGKIFTKKQKQQRNQSSNTLQLQQQNNPFANKIGHLPKIINPMARYDTFEIKRGQRQYELTNNLNNVLATISDRKMRDSASGNFQPVILHQTTYYPYGMPMPGLSDTNGYPYGFNGKEKDNSFFGQANGYNFGARIYDARTGRWMSVDPKADKYPNKSPYLAMSGDPINRIDPDGMEDDESKNEKVVLEDWEDLDNLSQKQKKKLTKSLGGKVEEQETNEFWKDDDRCGETQYKYKDAGGKEYSSFEAFLKSEFAFYNATGMTKKESKELRDQMDLGAANRPSVSRMESRPITKSEYKKGKRGRYLTLEAHRHKRKITLKRLEQLGNNPGAAVAGILSHYSGRSFEDQKKDIALGSAIWGLVSSANAMQTSGKIGNTGPSANQRQKDFKSVRGKGVK